MITLNENLQELWEPHENFVILNGEVLIQGQLMLCPKVTENFIRNIKVQKSFYQRVTYGSDMQCDRESLNSNVTIISPTSVVIYWNNYVTKPYQILLGYVITYFPSPSKSITHIIEKSCFRYVLQVL